jgi:glycosyltransferase involved in cell wall biosynthesis
VAPIPRVAFFTDTYTEINGVALTSRQLAGFATRRGYPFLCVRGAKKTNRTQDEATTHLELARSPLSVNLDKGLWHDPALWRHRQRVSDVIQDFRPDLIHVVSPGDVSEIGVSIARKLNIPLAISWHTNLHEFGAMRLEKLLRWVGKDQRRGIARFSERKMLDVLTWFYRLGDVLYAPNDELVDMLQQRTRKPVFLMKRGIDTELFRPSRRTMQDGLLRLGFVGRITPEKSVRFLYDLETGLRAAGVPDFRLLIVGDGSERAWLRKHLAAADLPGILRGDPLAEAYANMDVFVFPSRTDTFGNVVLESLASGVPAVVTDAGGPKFIVREGVSGFVARNHGEFIGLTARLLRDPEMRARMGQAAREQACGESWDTVFECVYEGYRTGILARRNVF